MSVTGILLAASDVAEITGIIRDVVIILIVGGAFIASLVAAVVSFMLYRKVLPLIESARKTVKNAEDISSTVSEQLVKPLVARSSLAFGAGQVASFILGLTRRKGGKKNGK